MLVCPGLSVYCKGIMINTTHSLIAFWTYFTEVFFFFFILLIEIHLGAILNSLMFPVVRYFRRFAVLLTLYNNVLCS